MNKTLIRLSIAVVMISIIFAIKLYKTHNAPPRSSLDKKILSKTNPYIQSIPEKLKEAKGYLPELKETLLQMDDKYIDSSNNYTEKEKQWLKEYRNTMLMNLQHVNEKDSSVKVFTSTDSQIDFERLKKEIPGISEKDLKSIEQLVKEGEK